MKITKALYTITEYDSFVSELFLPGCTTLPKATFDQLEDFILSSQTTGHGSDSPAPMELRIKRGIGKIITAKHYVGVLLLKDGTTIEILPKICSRPEETFSVGIASSDVTSASTGSARAASGEAALAHTKARTLLIDMLKTLKSSPFKNLQSAPLEAAKLPLLEIFIQMFLTEVLRIVKQGLKCSYQLVQSNETQFKGKWKVAQYITHNYAHKERAILEYELYHVNRAENRLLKATLHYLYQISSSAKNKTTIKILLNEFREVTASTHYQEDFAQCISDRTMQHYETALLWCRIFLKGKSFTPFSGSEAAAALLFPMEVLFERYVAAKLKQRLTGADFQVLLQDTSHHLFDEPRRQFLLKPDIVVIRNRDQAVFLLDTKWKLLSANQRQYGISSEDMYQMYAYQKKYQAENVRLLYPLNPDPEFASLKPIVFRSVEKQGDAAVLVEFVDLFHMEDSLARIVKGFL